MLTPEKIRIISAGQGVEIRSDKGGLITGRVKLDEKHRNFRISYGEGYAYLQMRRDSQEILHIFEQVIGKAQLRGENRDLIGKSFFYAWNADANDRENLFKGMSFAVARGKLWGWQKVEKLAA